FATARSGLPSLFTSPLATEYGLRPVSNHMNVDENSGAAAAAKGHMAATRMRPEIASDLRAIEPLLRRGKPPGSGEELYVRRGALGTPNRRLRPQPISSRSRAYPARLTGNSRPSLR